MHKTSSEANRSELSPFILTAAEEALMSDYTASVDGRVLSFINEVISKSAKSVEPIEIAVVNKTHADVLYEITGTDYSGYRVILTGDAVKHIIKRHGQGGKSDESMSDPKDIARIGWVINNFDNATKVDKTTAYSNANGTRADVILLKKRVNGFYYAAEAVPVTKKKAIFIQSAYKNKT